MKIALSFLGVFFCFFTAMAQQHKLVQLWQTDTLLKVPESVLPDFKNKVLYVTNIDGQPWDKDGKGSVGKVSMDGKIIKVDWVPGLNMPKGMGLYNNHLYVADFDELVVIDVAKEKIVKKIKVEGAQGLNDVTISNDGVVYVTDSKGMKVYRVQNDAATLYLADLKGPNGILWSNNALYLMDKGGLYKVNDDKSLSMIADGMKPSTDGVEAVNNTDFIVSSWAGAIYYVNGSGKKELLLDSEADGINTADIGYNAAERILYVPTFYKNKIIAYRLQ